MHSDEAGAFKNKCKVSDWLDLSNILLNYEDLPVLRLFQSLLIPVSQPLLRPMFCEAEKAVLESVLLLTGMSRISAQ